MGEVSASRAASLALEAIDRGEAAGLVTAVSGPGSGSPGRRLVVIGEEIVGSLGEPELDAKAVELAREAIANQARGLRSVAVESGTWELYVESQQPQPELLIIGAGHIARPLHRLGAMLGFRVTVIDDRAEYANNSWFPEAGRVLVIDFADPFREIDIRPDTYIVLVTRAHKCDYDCIRELLKMPARPAYLGMIGSRRRVRAAFDALVKDGIDPERLEGVRAPIGLDIAAETPEEIALAIAAEIVAVRRGGSGSALTERERVLDRLAAKRDLKK